MRQAQSSGFPQSADTYGEKRRKARAPVTERVAGWSARHRKTAVFGWLLLVVTVFTAGQAIGSAQLTQYDAGQAGQAERVLNKVAPAQYNAYAETVLIQANTPGITFGSDPAMRQAEFGKQIERRLALCGNRLAARQIPAHLCKSLRQRSLGRRLHRGDVSAHAAASS